MNCGITTDDPWSDRIDITPAGNVGIGTSSPSYLPTVNGTAYAAGAAGALSDRRHKSDIALLDADALAIVARLKPVTFVWKEPKDDGMRGRQIGFVAQDVETIVPEAVLTMNNEERDARPQIRRADPDLDQGHSAATGADR